MNRVVTNSLREVNVVLFVLEARHFDERDKQVLELLPQDRPVILVINKADLMQDKNELLPFIQEISATATFCRHRAGQCAPR